MKSAIVTGSAGFIGFHLSKLLLAEGWTVTGVDALTDYYDVSLKKRRHAMLSQSPNFTPIVAKVEDEKAIANIISTAQPEAVIHLAAQAGVRYSIEAPRSYFDANLDGTFTLLEAIRAQSKTNNPVKHTLIASTSSVYGSNSVMPYAETHRVAHPMSFYAATKVAGEAISHSYSSLYDIPMTLFRFFTVYGPWGRPDMALFKFTKAILRGEPIDVYNNGNMQRDFTYVDDLILGIAGLINSIPEKPGQRTTTIPGDSLSPVAPWRTVNIGNGKPAKLMDFISAIEKATKIKARKNFMEMQPGDVPSTWADNNLLNQLTGYEPKVTLDQGVASFIDWYQDYYGK